MKVIEYREVNECKINKGKKKSRPYKDKGEKKDKR